MQVPDLVRYTCQQWNLVKDRLVCAKWRLSSVSTKRVTGLPDGEAPPAKPWPPVLFPGHRLTDENSFVHA